MAYEIGLMALKPTDNLDDRREVVVLLQKLTPGERTQFLQHWSRQAPIPVAVDPFKTTGELQQTADDLMQLTVHFGVPRMAILQDLERWAARKPAIVLATR